MVIALVNHLWQSTLVVFGVGLLALVLRHDSAKIRYGLWLAASLKFLVPFAALTLLSAQVSWRFNSPEPITSLEQTRATASQFAVLVDRVVAPVAAGDPAPGMDAAQEAQGREQPANPLLDLLRVIWTIGAIAIVVRWLQRWCHIRRLLRASKPVGIRFPVAVRSSAMLHEPGVVGFVRPVLLMPEGIEHRLTPEQLRSVLAHELCHVRRRDNLTAALHMIVEVVFWFYPLVWWLGARLVAERERACDEEVLQNGNSPEAYAEGILRICQHYLQSPLPCAAGVGGADLKSRIETIMLARPVVRLHGAKKLLLAAAAFVVLTTPLVAGLLMSPNARAQSALDTAESRRNTGDNLLIAVSTRDLFQVRTLLDSGADVNYQNDSGVTALTQAAQMGQEKIVQELLARGAQVDHQRADGATALHLAAGRGNEKIVQLLLDHGADVDHQAGAGYTALIFASGAGHEGVVRRLLNGHADLDRKNGLGETALLQAAQHGHDRIVRLLLDQGADIHQRRFDGQTALNLAAQARQVKVVQILLSRNADR